MPTVCRRLDERTVRHISAPQCIKLIATVGCVFAVACLLDEWSELVLKKEKEG